MAQLVVFFSSNYLHCMIRCFFLFHLCVLISYLSVVIHCISLEASMRSKHVCVLTATDSRANIWCQYNTFNAPPPLSLNALCSKAVVLVVFIVYCCFRCLRAFFVWSLFCST